MWKTNFALGGMMYKWRNFIEKKEYVRRKKPTRNEEPTTEQKQNEQLWLKNKLTK